MKPLLLRRDHIFEAVMSIIIKGDPYIFEAVMGIIINEGPYI